MSDQTAVVTWQEKMKQYAVQAAATERPSGQFFSIKSGVLAFGGVPIPNNTMDVIVLASLHENVFYPSRYNAEKSEGPRCFAFSHTGENMTPHNLAVEQQAAACKSCPKNAWGSDPSGGRGKACKNVRRLSILPGSAVQDPEKVMKATVGYLRVPVTSVAAYQRFVAGCASVSMPPFAMMCRVRVVPDAKTQVRVEFEALGAVTDQHVLEKLIERHEAELTLIDFPYQPSPEGEAPSHQIAVPPPQNIPVGASKF